MKISTTYNFFRQLENDDISFLYQGNFSDRITSMVIRLVENNIAAGFSKLKNKISFLMIESFQNIIRHGDDLEVEDITTSPGLFLTRSVGSTYYITSANLIENQNVESLRGKLEQVNVLDESGLKDLYFEVLGNKQLSDKGGAGLGLIQMARKSGEKLDFDFVKVNDMASFFYLQLKLKSKAAEISDGDIPIAIARDFHQVASHEDIFLVHKGNYSQESIKPVLRMVESNITQAEKQSVQKLAFHMLVEILQNISRHGFVTNDRREGIFLMGQDKNDYIMSTGNYIDNRKVERFKSQIDLVNSLDRPALDKLYKQTLREGKITEGGGAGLGLIDVARESKGNIEYEFVKIDEEKSFFTMLTKL